MPRAGIVRIPKVPLSGGPEWYFNPANGRTGGLASINGEVMSDFYTEIMNVLPDFNVDKCRWIHRLDVWESENGRCCRIVLCFDDHIDLTFLATGVREFTLGNRERTPGRSRYAPYDLGEFFIQKLSPEGRVRSRG